MPEIAIRAKENWKMVRGWNSMESKERMRERWGRGESIRSDT